MALHIQRREFITLLGGTWPLAARASGRQDLSDGFLANDPSILRHQPTNSRMTTGYAFPSAVERRNFCIPAD